MLDPTPKPQRRVWRYRYSSWQPSWWRYLPLVPYFGGDEWGRHTVVFHVPPFGFVCFAYRTCGCEDCADVRAQTAQWAQDERDEGPWCEHRDEDDRWCLNRTKNPDGLCDNHERTADA